MYHYINITILMYHYKQYSFWLILSKFLNRKNFYLKIYKYVIYKYISLNYFFQNRKSIYKRYFYTNYNTIIKLIQKIYISKDRKKNRKL